jgi:hypothetical protein
VQIKNRESAARSRAKRVEYTATLEERVALLNRDNLELRKQVLALVRAQACGLPNDTASD